MKKEQNKKNSENAGQKPRVSPKWQLAVFVLVIVLTYCWLYNTVYTTFYSGVGSLFYDYASRVLHGQVPYLDFDLEYPPLALLFFVLPRLIASSPSMYVIFFKAEVLIAILLGLFIIYLISKRIGKAPWKLMLVYLLCILAVGPIMAEQFDIFPTVLTLGSVYAFMVGKTKTSWALLAIGALTKIYPLFLAPVFLLIDLKNRRFRSAFAGILTAVLIGSVFTLPFVFIGSDSIKSLIEYHLQRGLQLESTYSSFLLIANKTGLVQTTTVFNFGSWNLVGNSADILSRLSFYFLIVFLLLAYWFISRNIKPGKSQSTRIGTYSLLVFSVVLITSKVLSPQYFIWLIPLIPMVFQRGRNVILALFILIGGFTYYLFPHAYLNLTRLETIPVIVLFVRNILLITFMILTIVSLERMKSSA